MGTISLLVGCQPNDARRRGIRSVSVSQLGGYLEFVARQRTRDQQSKVGANRTKAKESLFEENLKLETEGYVYHPNLLEFTLGSLFGLLQEDFEEESAGRKRTSADDGPILEFDFRGEFFNKKEYPGVVYARRNRTIDPRPFQPSLEITTTTYGLTWQYVNPKTPTIFQFSDTDVRLDPHSELEDKGRQHNTQLRFETRYRVSDNNVFSLIQTRESVEEEPFALSYDTNELTLGHKWNFGRRHRHRLDSELNYFDQRGTFDTERFRWREVLRLDHSDVLRSWYLFEMTDRKQGSLSGVPPIDERSYSVSATLEHRLYESVVSQLNLRAQDQEFGSGLEIRRWGVDAGVEYRKQNRWGALLGDYRLSLERERQAGGGQLGEVLDESHTFQDPDPLTLANMNIDLGSILMTAEDRTTIYRLGRDFTVHTVGDRLEIRRIPTGRIVDEQTVLVDYIFSVGGSFTLETINHHLTVRQDYYFGLSPYYRLQHQNQELSPKAARGVTPEDITAHLIGAEYRKGPLLLITEYEDHHSTINPFEAIRLSATYTRRFRTGATGRFKARWTEVDHEPPNKRETRFLTLEGYYRHPLTKNLSLEGTALFRREKDSLSGDDEGVELDLSFEWTIRETDLRITYEYGKFEDDFAENETSAIYVRARRRF